jgi:hypothetical protein
MMKDFRSTISLEATVWWIQDFRFFELRTQVSKDLTDFLRTKSVVIRGALALLCFQMMAWATPPAETPGAPERVMELLRETPSGFPLVEAATEAGVPIEEGKVSRTEVTATRVSRDGEAFTRFETKVVLSRSKSPVFQALDLAHELVHALRPKENPFNPDLMAGEYVVRGIEGEGGEAEAILHECRVAKDFLEHRKFEGRIGVEERALVKARCATVWKLSVNEGAWKRSFYQLGQHTRDFLERISKRVGKSPREWNWWKERVDSRSPLFSSAVAQKPYPLALLEEYEEITARFCEKALKREEGRAPAGDPGLGTRCGSTRGSGP